MYNASRGVYKYSRRIEVRNIRIKLFLNVAALDKVPLILTECKLKNDTLDVGILI